MAIDARSASTGSTSATTRVWNHTLGSGSDKVLIVLAGSTNNPARAVTGVNWDSAGTPEALTRLGGAQEVNPYCWIEIWYKKNPTARGTKQITVTYAGTCECAAGAISLDGDQVTLFNAASPQSHDSWIDAEGQPALTVTSAVGEFVVAGVACAKSGASTDVPIAGGSQNLIMGVDASPGNDFSSYGAIDAAGAATVVMNMTGFNSGINAAWVVIGASVRPGAGAPSGDPGSVHVAITL